MAAAVALAGRTVAGLRVVTNSTVVARTLGGMAQISVTGGAWQANNQSLAGPAAAAFADRYRCDVLLTSCGGIDPDGWLLEFRDEDVVAAQAMLANARRRVLLVDHSKFARVAACKLARLADMTTIVTDRLPSPPMQRLIAEGEPVAMPTETVYGLAADATQGQAVAKIYAAKGRPSFNPLIVHVLDLEAAQEIGEFSADARALTDAHWPGPLTIVAPPRRQWSSRAVA